MSLLDAERIKLFSTRSPWWSMGLVLVFGLAFAALVALFQNDQLPLSVAGTQGGVGFGQFVIMVMAAIAVTNEYRFGTIRSTFLAVPNRTVALTAKTVLITLVAAVVGLVTAFASWGIAALIDSGGSLAIDTGAEWRAVAGNALVYAAVAIIAVAVGILVRQTAGAISLLLVWSLVIETIIAPILDATLDTSIGRWLPFANLGNFITGGDRVASGAGAGFVVEYPFGPWGSLGYFVAVALVLLVLGFAVAERRDA